MNYTKSSCIIFCTKMFQYYHKSYCLQEESTHFGTDSFSSESISTVFWNRKSCKKNQQYSAKDFELYQLFMNNFLCQNVPILSLYILVTRKSDTFSSGTISTVWTQSQQYSQRLYRLFMNTFLFQTVSTSQTTYHLLTKFEPFPTPTFLYPT